MSTKISLTNGGWASIRDTAAVPVKLRRPIEKAMMKIGQSQSMTALQASPDLNDKSEQEKVAASLDLSIIDEFNELNDLTILARVESWSFASPITLDSLGDLIAADYDILKEECAKNATDMLPKFDFNNDPDSPIKPSDA